MKKIIFFMAVVLIMLSGCSTPTKLVPAVKEDPSKIKGPYSAYLFKLKYFKNPKLIDTKTPGFDYMLQHGYVRANKTKYSMCNYFLKPSCGDNISAKWKPVEVSVTRTSLNLYKLYGNYAAPHMDKMFRDTSRELGKVIEQNDAVFKVTVTGLSTEQRITVFPKHEKNGLMLFEALQGKLKPDWRGFVISGEASIRIPDQYLSDADKGARLVLPIKFGLERKYINRGEYDDVAFYFAVQDKFDEYAYIPDTFSSSYFGTVTGFKLLDKMAEYAGWVKDEYLVELKAAQKLKAQQYQNKRDLEEKKFKAELAAINNGLANAGLVKIFNHYSEVNEVCTQLRSGSRQIDRFDCSRYQSSLVSGCKSTLRQYERRYDRDIADICPVAEKYHKKFSTMFSQQSRKSFDTVLREYEQKNSVTGRTFESDFPYTRFDTDDLAKKLSNAEEAMDKAWIKGIQEKSNSDLRKKLMGLDQPSATDKMFKKFYKDTRDFAANDKRLNEESKRSSYKYTQPDSKSSGTSKNNSHTKSALSVSSKNKTKSYAVTSAASSHGNGRISLPEGACDTRNLPRHKTPGYTVTGNNAERDVSNKNTAYVKQMCGDRSTLSSPVFSVKCEYIQSAKTQQCVSAPVQFTCGCAKRGDGTNSGRGVSK